MAVEIPQDLLNFLRSEEQRSKDDSLDRERATAIEFYQGMPYGDEVDGRSQAVTRDVAEVIDYQTLNILGTMVSGDKVVEFETSDDAEQGPQGVSQDTGSQMPADQQNPSQPPAQGQQGPKSVNYGQQATVAIQYQFMRKQPGYRILHDSLKAGLLEKTGIVKTFAEPQPPKPTVYNLPAEAMTAGDDGPVTIDGKPILSADPLDEGWQPGMESVAWRVTVAEPQPPLFRDEAIPNEEFLCSPDARTLDDAPYLAHRTPKSISNLVAMGYAKADLETIWGGLPADSVVETARDADRSQTQRNNLATTGANRKVWLLEEYPLWDLDGDGFAERLFIHRIGSTILKVMPIDEQPFSLWSPFPMQHRLIGQSSADKTMDIQRYRSVLLRQGLDSLYLGNAPRFAVSDESQNESTLDDLLTVRPGGLVRYKGGNPPTPLQFVDTSAQAFNGMEMLLGERESRTGVTRHNQGLNPDSLNKTASGMAMLQAAGDQVELYIARNFAEFIVAPIFSKRYRLMRQHGQPFAMKIDGQRVMIDPRQWPEECDMAINVGLGTGRKDQRLVYRMQLLGIQQQIMQAGLPIVGPEQLFNSVKGLVADAALGTPTDFVLDPATVPPQQPQPDADTLKVQSDHALQQQKQQNDAQQAAMDHEQAMAKIQTDAELKARAQDADLQAKREAAALDTQLKQDAADRQAAIDWERLNRETALNEARLSAEMALKNKQIAAKAGNGSDDLPLDRPGGSVAQ